jgi:hypothetical protein
MLGFFSRKPIHPLAQAREAKRVFAEIAGHEPLNAVEEAGAWLESLASEQDFKLAQRLEVVLRLDDAAVASARRLGRDYPSVNGASRAQEARHWEFAHGYWQQLSAAYIDCMSRHGAAEEKEANAVRPQLPLLYGRAIHALAMQLKWKQFHYGPVDPGFWMTLGGIYLAAVEAKVAQKPLQLYSGGIETTIEAEYLKNLIFHATSMDKLQPLAIEIAERLINHFLPYFALIRELRPDNVYWVDVAKPLPPTRLARIPEVTPTLRFFSGTRAVDAVKTTIEQIRQEDRVPPGINLGVNYPVGEVLPVLEHLAICWAPKPPMRSTARHRIHSPLKVVHGLVAVHRRLANARHEDERVESWVIDDVSLGGLGVQASISRPDWIRIGALIGMQPEGGDNWLIGIVRRYVRTGPNQGSVGVETISRTPRAVLANAGGLVTEALLLDAPEVGERTRMALPADALEDNVALVFALDGKDVRVHPQETIATGVDFVVAGFLVQSFG